MSGCVKNNSGEQRGENGMAELKTVLMVDDEEEFCRLVKQNLEDTGRFKVFLAHNGKDGIASAGAEVPDLILLDVMMPDMDGPEVAAVLARDKRTCSTPIIFLTAIVQKTELGINTVGKIGKQPYIAKPVSTGDLIKAIDEILETKQKGVM